MEAKLEGVSIAVNSQCSTLPIIIGTLVMGVWFSYFSYYDSFGYLIRFFLLDADFWMTRPWYEIMRFGLLWCAAILIALPATGWSHLKWGIVAMICMLLFAFNSELFPDLANHSYMMLFIAIGFFCASVTYLLRGQWQSALTHIDYLPLLRAALVIMYFFGTFHKINTDFLSPAGCWVSFYMNIPIFPEFLKDPMLGLWLGGYGTLVVEFIAMLGLLHSRTKYWAMLLGMGFHFLIGISTQETVAHFSAFAVALHMSFLSPDAPQRFLSSRCGSMIARFAAPQVTARFLVLAFMLAMIPLSAAYHFKFAQELWPHKNFLINLMWWIYAVPLFLFVAFYGRTRSPLPKPLFFSRVWVANSATVLLCFNSITAYIGISSHGDLAMFSNLVTEGRLSNHYLLQSPIYLFHNLEAENYARITHTNHPSLKKYRGQYRWVHRANIRRMVNDKRMNYDATPYTITLQYADMKIETISSDHIEHPFMRPPTWFEQHVLRFTNYDARKPRPCSSR